MPSAWNRKANKNGEEGLLGRQIKGAVLLTAVIAIFYAGRIIYPHFVNEEVITRPPYSEPAAGTMTVKIDGACAKVGIYYLSEETTVAELIEMAECVDLKGLDEAVGQRKLYDGSMVCVTNEGTVSMGEMSVAARLALDMPIALNSVTKEELELVRGIGPITAEAIIKHRAEIGGFRTKDELKSVSGIGNRKYESLEKYFFIRAP